MSREWWRRNLIVAPVMVLVLGALGWALSGPARDVWWAGHPRVPHTADPSAGDGWTTIDDIGVRLAEFDVAPPVDDDVPAGFTAWRATIEVRTEGSESRYCDAELEDTEGKRYASGSSYLPRYDDVSFAIECGTGEEPSATTYFLLPDDAEPRAVRLSGNDLLPDYWELPTG